MPSRQIGFRAFSSAYEYFDEQYPHQSANGRRELRAMERDSGGSFSPAHSRTSGSRDRSKINSVDTIRAPSSLSNPGGGDAMSDTSGSRDLRRKYAARRAHSQSESFTQHSHNNSTTTIGNNGNSNRAPQSPESEMPPAPDFSDMDDGTGQPAVPADLGSRGVHVPTRTSSSHGISRRGEPLPPLPIASSSQHGDVATPHSGPPSPEDAEENAFDRGARSSAGSILSNDTAATSIHTLPPLQTKGPETGDAQYLEPVLEDDPRSWDLVAPPQEEQEIGTYSLEKRSELLFGAEHLRTVFADPKLLLRFTGFLNSHRPKSIPILIYYLDALKALRAINYANAIAEALEPIPGQDFTQDAVKPTANSALEERAKGAFDVLVQEDMPAFIAHAWVQVVSVSIQRRITGTLAPHLREASEGLAEVFCLTDPSRHDNPIVFASEEFTRTTQYGMNYIIGRNCRFLQGPKTSPHSVQRLAAAVAEGKEHTEVLLNYRRDGSPFMNLLMTAPLMDSRGTVRYFIGAQVDVSGLIKDCSEMDGLARLVKRIEQQSVAAAAAAGEGGAGEDEEDDANHKDEFQELSEMFNGAELETVWKYGGRMHKEYVDETDRESVSGKPRLVLKDPTQDILDRERQGVAEGVPASIKQRLNGKLEGIYQHYLLIRPAPSLRILFTSPSLRVPGILQSPFLNRIGGSSRVRADLGRALAEGRGVTAKIRWLIRPDEDGEGEGRSRWIHCTPLLGHTGAVGVWMIVLVDDETSAGVSGNASSRRFRQAPPVSNTIGGKEWDASRAREQRRRLTGYDRDESERKGAGSSVGGGNASSRPVSRTTDYAVSPRPSRRSLSRRPEGPGHLTSADASEFSFNLRG